VVEQVGDADDGPSAVLGEQRRLGEQFGDASVRADGAESRQAESDDLVPVHGYAVGHTSLSRLHRYVSRRHSATLER
jgi:hypothetical protein